jgi:hypothetical protein
MKRKKRLLCPWTLDKQRINGVGTHLTHAIHYMWARISGLPLYLAAKVRAKLLQSPKALFAQSPICPEDDPKWQDATLKSIMDDLWLPSRCVVNGAIQQRHRWEIEVDLKVDASFILALFTMVFAFLILIPYLSRGMITAYALVFSVSLISYLGMRVRRKPIKHYLW